MHDEKNGKVRRIKEGLEGRLSDGGEVEEGIDQDG